MSLIGTLFKSPRTSTMTISNFPTTTLVFLFTKTTMKGSQLIQSLIGSGGKINFFEKRNPNFLIGVLWYSTPSVLHQLEKSNCYIHGASLFESFAEDFRKDAMMEDWVKKFEKLAGSQEHFNNLIWS
ncbi:hypothetical protein HYC85_011030 [Camellia sinensis]|uniref:Uncharacterized protein n=1 Tax=Camellia sinensis TaxID=4442 RepID=A0A7J7HMA6_CAMSI|nr:hypothetical protein HYC85_011030 [Camellia sinensis]